MDDTKKALLSIDIDTAALTQNAANAKAAVAALADQLNLLKASGKDSGDAFDKVSEQLKKAGDAADKSKEALKNYSDGLTDSGKAASDLSQQHAKLDGNTTKYSKTLKDYGKDLIDAAEKASPFAKSVGNTAKEFKAVGEITGQVGDAFSNYKQKVSLALDNSQKFNSSSGIFAKGFEVLKANAEVATGGIGGFSKALAATGIGLIIIAVAALIDCLSKFQPIVDKVEQVMAGFNGAIDAGKHILDAFFGSITSVGDLFSKLGNILAHPIDSLMNLGKAMATAAKKTYDLKKAQQELDEQVQASVVKNAEAEAKIAELKVKMLTASLAQRKEYQKQIKDIQNGETENHKKQVEEQVRISVDKVAATAGLTVKEIGDIGKLDEKKIESLALTKHLNAEEVKSLRDAVKQMAELRKDEADKMLAQHQEQISVHQTTSGKIKKNRDQSSKETIASTQTLANTVVGITVEGGNNAFKAQSAALNGGLILENKTDNTSIKSKKEISKEKLKLVWQERDEYKKHFGQVAGLFAKNTEVAKAAFAAQKAIAIAQIAINTEKQISESISGTKKRVTNDLDAGFPVGDILAVVDIAMGVADVASIIQNGAKQVSNLNSTNVQGFARGGMYLSDGYGTYIKGPGSGTSDSINAKLSNGESIINARSTEMFAPILSAINQVGGGRAFNTANTGNGYALGGIFSGSNVLNDSSSDLANSRALNDMAKTMAANMPRQILVVEDVQASLQNKAMLQSMSNF